MIPRVTRVSYPEAPCSQTSRWSATMNTNKFAMAYQCVLIAMLQRALKRSRLEPAKVEQAVNRFMFELGNFHAQGGLRLK